MSPAVAVPHTAPRPERARALRRALGTLVFLGGLLVLGLAFGGRAEAAESVPERLLEQTSASAAGTARAVEDAAGAVDAPEPARRTVTVTETPTVTDPARVLDAAVTAAEPVAAPVRAGVRETVDATLDRAAGAPVVGDVAGTVRDDVRDRTPVPLPVPVSVPTPGEDVLPEPAAGQAGPGPVLPVPPAARPATADAAEALPAPVRHLLRIEHAPEPAATVTAPRSAPAPDPAPVPAPGRPSGAVATGQTGAPRGGDEHAATLPARTPCAGPVRGTTLPATVAALPDRADEVLEFPG
ncbi:hypothetical protein [Streptomyces tritici]|uniref:hypothetical protein n=1 Tax=Streptomyces tritici TaxID=2054410 RepID=UPI003AEF684B